MSQQNDYKNQLTIYTLKYQKCQEEFQDRQRINKELEKIQSKFDSDMLDLKKELVQEIQMREKYERERVKLQNELYSLKADLDNLKLDLDYQKDKNTRLLDCIDC